MKILTSQQRLNITLKIMKTLNPSIYKWFHNFYSNNENTPRPFTTYIKKQNKTNLTGCEIGYGIGTNAKNLLKELPIEKLYCIEPYLGHSYLQGEACINSYRDIDLTDFRNLLKDNRIIFLPFHSSVAAEIHLKNIRFDFIYIDGNHTYEYVKDDLERYTKLLKPNGAIGGHDYIYGQNGVIQAVQEHAIKLGIPPTIQFPDYWFQL